MRFNKDVRIAQILLALALEGPQTIYGLAKTISKYTCEKRESVRVSLYRVLPVILRDGFVTVSDKGLKKVVDITLSGYSALLGGFSNLPSYVEEIRRGKGITRPTYLDISFIIALSIENKFKEKGLTFVLAVKNFIDPLFSDFMKGWIETISLRTMSFEAIWKWDKEYVLLKKLDLKYSYIFNSLVSYFDYNEAKSAIKASSVKELVEELVEPLDIDREVFLLRFIDDFSENVRESVIWIFLIYFTLMEAYMLDYYRFYGILYVKYPDIIKKYSKKLDWRRYSLFSEI